MPNCGQPDYFYFTDASLYPLNPFLKFIYWVLRMITWAGLYVFYRRRVILGREHLDFDGPAIVVVNHPSTLMDVLNPCIHIRQECFFLANYGLFKHPVSRWLLTRLYCIPVKRREDVAEGEGRNNDAAFEQSIRHMERKGLLFIAAEGVSWMDRVVRPFKTGAARIAFGAEKRLAWQAGVKILPVGLSYSAPNLFRSEVIVHFGAPIEVAAWQSAYEADPDQAIEGFTEALQQSVSRLTLDVHSLEQQPYVEQLEAILKPQFPRPRKAYFAFRKSLIERHLHQKTLERDTASYAHELHQHQVSEMGLQAALETPNWPKKIALLALAPFACLGYACWFLPCYLPWRLARQLKLYIGYDSNVKFLSGLFTIPLAGWGLFELMTWMTGSIPLAWLSLPAAVLLGWLTEYWLDLLQRRRARQRALALPADTRRSLIELRTRLLNRVANS